MYKEFSETEGGPCFLRPFKYDPLEHTETWEPYDQVRDTLSPAGKRERHARAWRNEFAFAWEVGMYHNLTVGGMLIFFIISKVDQLRLVLHR